MADDLDDFFDEIEEVAHEAVKEEGESATTDDPNNPLAGPLGEDAVEHDEPPSKKVKMSTSATHPVAVRPRGLVVAAASSVVVRMPQETTENGNSNDASRASSSNSTKLLSANYPTLPLAPSSSMPPPPPPPPLPPPPPQQQNQAGAAAAASKKPIKRMAAGKVWVDPTLDEWPSNDFRIFVGNLDKGVTDQQLHDHYQRYPSLAKSKIVCDPKGISKGYGFCSFLEPLDCAKAIRETDQSWLGSRPIRVKRSDWKDRNLNQVVKKTKKQQKQRERMGL
jgi:hypothetical protein